jgi:hypothetical protein
MSTRWVAFSDCVFPFPRNAEAYDVMGWGWWLYVVCVGSQSRVSVIFWLFLFVLGVATGVAVRVTNRPGQQLLGANGRDEGPGVWFSLLVCLGRFITLILPLLFSAGYTSKSTVAHVQELAEALRTLRFSWLGLQITAYTREGLNRLSFSAYDARAFCLGVRIVQRKSLQEVDFFFYCLQLCFSTRLQTYCKHLQKDHKRKGWVFFIHKVIHFRNDHLYCCHHQVRFGEEICGT